MLMPRLIFSAARIARSVFISLTLPSLCRHALRSSARGVWLWLCGLRGGAGGGPQRPRPHVPAPRRRPPALPPPPRSVSFICILLPLTSLPAANRPLLAYQLEWLASSGVRQVFLVAPEEYCLRLNAFLQIFGNDLLAVDLIPVADMTGSADALRAVSDRVTSDVIVVSSDLVTQVRLQDIADAHLQRRADVTVLLAAPPLEEAEKGKGPRVASIDDEDREFVGLCEDGRLVVKTPGFEVEDSFRLSKHLLHRCTALELRRDLLDVGCCVLSRWVLQFVKARQSLASLRSDVLPYIVRRQFQRAGFLEESLPFFRVRKSSLQDLDEWLAGASVSRTGQGRVRPSLLRLTSFGSVDPERRDSDSAAGGGQERDLLRCYAAVQDHSVAAEEAGICRRVTNLQSYMTLTRSARLSLSQTFSYQQSQGLPAGPSRELPVVEAVGLPEEGDLRHRRQHEPRR